MEVNKEQQTDEVVADKPKKKKPLQISLTFKRTSEIEMELYEHLQSKFYQGAYIKELLINQMLMERPDIAKKYGIEPKVYFNVPTGADATFQQFTDGDIKTKTEYMGTYDQSTGETTFHEEVVTEDEQQTDKETTDEETSDDKPTPSGSLGGGLLATLGEFL